MEHGERAARDQLEFVLLLVQAGRVALPAVALARPLHVYYVLELRERDLKRVWVLTDTGHAACVSLMMVDDNVELGFSLPFK